jgi:hypothetical protein
MESEAISQFAAALRGKVIGRDDEGYEEACGLYNGMIRKRPLVIAQCVDAADVMAAVNFGRDQRLDIAAAATTARVSEVSTMVWSSTCRK